MIHTKTTPEPLMLNANCTILTVQDPTQLRLDTTMQVRPAVLQVRVIYMLDISIANSKLLLRNKP